MSLLLASLLSQSVLAGDGSSSLSEYVTLVTMEFAASFFEAADDFVSSVDETKYAPAYRTGDEESFRPASSANNVVP